MGVWSNQGPVPAAFLWYPPSDGPRHHLCANRKALRGNEFCYLGLEIEVTLNSNSNGIKSGRACKVPTEPPPSGDLYLELSCCEVTAIQLNSVLLHLYSVCRNPKCFQAPRRIPQATAARLKSLFNREKPWTGPGLWNQSSINVRTISVDQLKLASKPKENATTQLYSNFISFGECLFKDNLQLFPEP